MSTRACAAGARLTSAELLALACSLFSVAPGCAREEPQVRIVLITLDTLRYDRFDGPRASMPMTRALAERGLRFERAYSATSTTQPTHASIFTGLHPWQHGVTHNGAVLDASLVTTTEILHDAGFHTAAVVASFPLARRFGFDQGFDVYQDEFQVERQRHEWAGTRVDEDLFYSLADEVSASAVKLIDEAGGAKQFFWFHFYDPHAPYGDSTPAVVELPELNAAARARSPELAELLERARGLYDADVAHMDRALGRVFERLARDEPRIATHVIVTSDHGELFGEHGSLGHGKRLTREEVHVPLIIASPHVEPLVRRDTTGSIDLAPTLLGFAGIAPARSFRGRDLCAPAASARAPTVGMRRTYAKPFPDVRTTGEVVEVQGPWFYVVKDDVLCVGDDRHVEAETGAVDAAFLEHARGLFGAFRSELEKATVHEDLDPGTQKALEALGYTQ